MIALITTTSACFQQSDYISLITDERVPTTEMYSAREVKKDLRHSLMALTLEKWFKTFKLYAKWKMYKGVTSPSPNLQLHHLELILLDLHCIDSPGWKVT